MELTFTEPLSSFTKKTAVRYWRQAVWSIFIGLENKTLPQIARVPRNLLWNRPSFQSFRTRERFLLPPANSPSTHTSLKNWLTDRQLISYLLAKWSFNHLNGRFRDSGCKALYFRGLDGFLPAERTMKRNHKRVITRSQRYPATV